MFTDRFIRVPVEMYDKKQAELTGNDDETTFESYLMVNPLEILSYRPKHDDDHMEENATVVDFKNGTEIIVFMPIYEFEKLLNSRI